MKRLEGKIAIVTGASSGIGRAVALRFAAEGARVLAVARRESLDELSRNADGEIVPYRCDVAVPEQVAALFEECRNRFGRLDVLCNNAGIGSKPNMRIQDTDIADWDRVMNVNLRGNFLVLKYGIPLLLASGGGSIVIVASVGSFLASPGSSPYIASKGGQLQLMKTAALECIKDNIRVNAVCPGVTRTAILDGLPDELMHVLSSRVPMGRLCTPEEVASLALFLASDEASHITGAAYIIDGGRSAG
jgi:meso-butanediol dehydrogenase / (S,S)-butanediol dehydrogenase / diacetyl reductase